MSYPDRPLTPDEAYLVKGSSRYLCFVCNSQQLRPLVLLAREGCAPGDSRHYITYSHDAIFGCDACHSGYAEIRRNDTFDWEECFDQDEHCVLDRSSVESLAEALKACPAATSEACTCPVHTSLRESWAALPRMVWGRYTGAFPAALLRMADPDQSRIVLSGICVEVERGLPRLALKNGTWKTYDAEGKLQAEGNYLYGLLSGSWTFWHSNGSRKSQGEYAHDMREGKWVEWNERGEVVAEETFHLGNPVKPQE